MAITINHQTNDISATSGSMTIDGSSVGVDNTKMPLAGGTFTGDIIYGDNVKAKFGAGSDLQIYHDGTDTQIDNNTGTLIVRSSAAGTIEFRDQGSQVLAQFNDNSDVKLYHNNNEKLATTSTGVSVTGSIHAEDGAGANIGIKSTAGSHWKLGDAVGASNGTFALYDYTNSALRLAVDSSGNILVGTTSTGATTASDGAYITQDGQIIGRATGIVSYLNRRGSDGDILSLMKDGTGIGSVGNSGNNFYFQAQASDGKAQIKTHDGNEGISLSPSGYITFETAGSERMRLDSSGNLMVGGTTPGNAGTVTLNAGNAGSTVGGLQLWSTTSGTSYVQFGDESGTAANHYRGFLAYAHNGDSLRFGTAGSERMRLESDGDLHVDGNVIAYSTTISDERLKEDIKPITGALDKVGQLSGYTFTYKADGKQSAGVIAQEVEKVLPSAVTESTLPLQTDDDVEYKTVQYDQLVGLLIESVKELKAEIEELKNGASK